jgi:protein-S-isoprenylcysteine O-methyltransferase Ste14
MATISTLLIIGFWLIFLGYWIVSARRVKPVAELPSRSSTLTYRMPLILGGFLFGCFRLRYPLNISLTPHTNLAQAIGVMTCVLGMALAIWSRRILAGNWSSEVTFKQGHELIQTGPYRFVRHPIYTGILMMFLGTGIANGQLHCWVGLVILFAAFWIKLNQEETLLLRHFPGDYPSYRSRVKALVPFVI